MCHVFHSCVCWLYPVFQQVFVVVLPNLAVHSVAQRLCVYVCVCVCVCLLIFLCLKLQISQNQPVICQSSLLFLLRCRMDAWRRRVGQYGHCETRTLWFKRVFCLTPSRGHPTGTLIFVFWLLSFFLSWSIKKNSLVEICKSYNLCHRTVMTNRTKWVFRLVLVMHML
jgi:hypothetical protein